MVLELAFSRRLTPYLFSCSPRTIYKSFLFPLTATPSPRTCQMANKAARFVRDTSEVSSGVTSSSLWSCNKSSPPVSRKDNLSFVVVLLQRFFCSLFNFFALKMRNCALQTRQWWAVCGSFSPGQSGTKEIIPAPSFPPALCLAV